KPVILDENSGEMVAPNGTMGQRWEEGKKWNLNLKRDDGSAIDPAMSVEKFEGEQLNIEFPFFDNSGNGTFTRPIMAKKVTLADGTTKDAATIYDPMLSQYGVNRFASELEAEGYDDEESVNSPAWQEKITSVK